MPIFFSRAAARCLAGMLSVLMVALPVAAQSSDDSVRNSGHLSARSPKSKSTKKKPAAKEDHILRTFQEAARPLLMEELLQLLNAGKD